MAKKAKKKGLRTRKYHSDERGHFVWDNYFIGGKQRRSKRRVTVVDGEIIDDSDEWLLANADDPFLIDCERLDLIGRRMLEDEGPQSGEQTMKPPPHNLRLDILELEAAFEFLAADVQGNDDELCVSFLNLTTGVLITSNDDEETEALWGDKNLLVLPGHLFEDLYYGSLDEFVDSLPAGSQRTELKRAIRGKGAFRRFKDIVFGGGNVELKHRWSWFETRRKRERIVQWLRDENIKPDWGRDIFEAPPLPDKRADLLGAVLAFVKDTRHLPGVRRIALLGSLANPKSVPKDVDLLVEIDDNMPLDGLARFKRQLLGKTMQTGDSCGAEVFLCNPQGEYIGRVCSWKTCAPGIRQSCQAEHCGRRKFLSDDLQNFRLDPSLISEPPVQLWPEIIARAETPDDVREELVTQLR